MDANVFDKEGNRMPVSEGAFSKFEGDCEIDNAQTLN